MNSLVIVLFLSGMVAMIILRTLHKDIARYNQIDSSVSKIYTFYVSTYKSMLLTESSSLEILRSHLDMVLGNLLWVAQFE